MVTPKYTRMAFMLTGLLLASSASAQVFDAKGNLQANVFVLQCQELAKVDAIMTAKQTDTLVGSFGYGYMHGYFTGRMYQFNNPNKPTAEQQADMDDLRTIYSEFMTDYSPNVVAALFRTFCSDSENATKSLQMALLTWVLRLDK